MKRGALCLVLSAFGFSLMAMLVRLVDDLGAPIPAVEKAFFRNLVAFFIALPAFLSLRARHPILPASNLQPPSSHITLLIILRSALGTLGLITNFYAISHIPIGDAMALNKTAPFFTVALSGIFLGEALRRRETLCLITAFFGALLVIKPTFSSVCPASLIGLLSGFCAGSAYAVLHRLGKLGVNGAFIVFVFSALSCAACLPFIALDPRAINSGQLLALIGAGGAAAVGQFAITWAYRYAEPRQIAIFDYSGIIFSALLGFAAFGQVPDVVSIAGFAVIIAAAFLLHHRRG